MAEFGTLKPENEAWRLGHYLSYGYHFTYSYSSNFLFAASYQLTETVQQNKFVCQLHRVGQSNLHVCIYIEIYT